MADTIETLGPRVVDTTKQLRFAGVLALTRTAVASQKAVRESLDKNFITRAGGRSIKFTMKGVRITPAKKGVEPFAEVFSVDWYIAQHEEGTRRKPPGAGDFHIPSFLFQVAGIPKDKPIKKSLRAKTILDKIAGGQRLPRIAGHRPFLAEDSDGDVGIFVRDSGDRLPIRLLYKLQGTPVEIDKNTWFFPVVDETFDKDFDGIYSNAVAEALRTA